MYTPEQTYRPIRDMMHIHPALSEVVDRAFQSFMPPEHYHHTIEHSHQMVEA
jgi:dihydrolipoamide dehydrogenase